MAAHVRSWAAGRGYEVQSDPARNLVIRVPASTRARVGPDAHPPGPPGHGVRAAAGHPNDPAEGRIVLQRDGDWLTADGTTLGADNGVAIAAMLALAEDESLAHGPLELLMTVAEEVGLEGANALDGSLLTGRLLLNLDSGEDGRLTVGCAGSTDTWIRLQAPRTAVDPDSPTLAVTASGGLGGHSGDRDSPRPRKRDQDARAGAGETLPDVPFRSSRSTVEGAGMRFRATRLRSARCRRPARPRFGRPSSGRPRRSATRTRRPIRA